jgi:hypothetical protein
MSNYQYANNPSTTLAGAVTAGATSISVASAADFPTAPQFTIIVDSEIMLVTGVAGTVWTVERGAESTVAATHNNNAAVTGVLTAGSLEGIRRGSGKMEVNGGFTNPYDTDLWVAGANRPSPSNLSQAIYAQLRVSGDMGAQVMDALAAEIRLNSISNSTFLNASEFSVVITGGANTIADARAITANLHAENSPTGTITAVKLIAAQTMASMGSLTVGTAISIYAEPQTIGTTDNWNIYAPTGRSLFGNVEISQDMSSPASLFFATSESLRWIIRKNTTAESGSNAGSDMEILARQDDGTALGTVMTFTRSNLAIKLGTGPLGFYGATPVSKQSVTGSRGGNAALASLLTALASAGLITNSSTA